VTHRVRGARDACGGAAGGGAGIAHSRADSGANLVQAHALCLVRVRAAL